MTYSNNPAYKELFRHGDTVIYFLADPNITQLHKSREVEASIQDIYSNAGATAEFIGGICDIGLKAIEDDPKNEQLRLTMINILSQLKYRTKYPVDSLCAIRMGAILSFMDGEPEECSLPWIDKKMQLAVQHPELYTFFLNWGIANTPSYSSHLGTLSKADYFNHREQMLQSMSLFKKELPTNTT